MNFWTGLATGFVLTTIFNQIRQENIINLQNEVIANLTNDEKTTKQENSTLKGRTTRKNNNHEERIFSLELRMSQAERWFGSMIRHSVEEPFKKEAIEKFLAEEELKDNSNG